jgi:predicted methyltransferase
MTKIEREKLLDKMVAKNEIGKKDKPVNRFMIGLFIKGADFKKVISWTETPERTAKKWWNNLEKNKYIKKNSKKLHLDKGFWKTGDICFLLMGACAQGYVKRRAKE